MHQFFKGIRHFISATGFVARHGLWYFYLFPLILSIAWYIGLFALLTSCSGDIGEWLIGPYLPEQDPQFEGFWSFLNVFTVVVIRGILSFLLGMLIYLLSTRFSKYIVLILLSPVFSILSEKTDEILTGRSYPFNPVQMLKDVLRGTIIALRNLCIELLLVGVFTIAAFFAGPFAILIVPLLWLLSAYFYGFSMMDYTCERRKMSISESVRFVRKNRGFVLGNGIMYAFLDKIPFVGLVIAPVNAVVGATTGLIELERNP
jgi:CysZ protein